MSARYPADKGWFAIAAAEGAAARWLCARKEFRNFFAAWRQLLLTRWRPRG
jgi:hypothetical protein